ncbi:MAG TPA: alkaline phosphatase family protein [Chloroflexota bacterium]|nr:alkaline phosphatase family protein [Chloroflexota bacterium]
MRFFGTSRSSRLFILGLDGSPLPLLRRLIADGDLPNLAALFESGSAREMTSSLPDVSAVAWTSVNTGKNPAKHGIYGFVDRKPGTRTLEVLTSAHVRSRTIWELVSEAGRRAVAINVPLSFPPQRINGVVISDFLAPSLSRAVYPTTLLPYLEGIGYRIDTDPMVARESLDAFLEDFQITAEKRAEAVLELMRREQWDLFMVVFMETDRLHHFLFQYIEDDDPVWGPKFREAYRQIDRLVGRIVGALGKDDQLIVLSDHGFTSLRREVYLNVWLEQQGYLRFESGKAKDLETVSPSSQAYSLDPGRIYVNLAGREAGGTVTAGELRPLVATLGSQLAALRDPDSGNPIVKDVYLADDIYHGPLRDRAPDLLVMPHDGYDIKGTFEAITLTGRGKLVGMHKYDNATFFVRGQRTVEGPASVRDVLPTACQLMKLECPEDIDGRSLLRS